MLSTVWGFSENSLQQMHIFTCDFCVKYMYQRIENFRKCCTHPRILVKVFFCAITHWNSVPKGTNSRETCLLSTKIIFTEMEE